jgi:hypothetical protein
MSSYLIKLSLNLFVFFLLFLVMHRLFNIFLQVDVFSSRDLDSRLNARELSAVKEWIENSTQPIHVMRDHPQHTIGMLGAAWDADLNRKNSREYWKEAWEKMMKDPLIYAAREKHGSDQFLLQRLAKVNIFI